MKNRRIAGALASPLFATALGTMLLVATAAPVAADDQLYLCRGAGRWGAVRLEIVDDGGACAGFEVRDRSGKTIQSFRGWIGSVSLAMYLNAERNLQLDRGWTFDAKTNLWMPPKR
jgi:hypothetical protein